jgi:hypothetical protein
MTTTSYSLSLSLFLFLSLWKKNGQKKEGKKREGDMSKDKSKNVQNSSNSILKLYI